LAELLQRCFLAHPLLEQPPLAHPPPELGGGERHSPRAELRRALRRRAPRAQKLPPLPELHADLSLAAVQDPIKERRWSRRDQPWLLDLAELEIDHAPGEPRVEQTLGARSDFHHHLGTRRRGRRRHE